MTTQPTHENQTLLVLEALARIRDRTGDMPDVQLLETFINRAGFKVSFQDDVNAWVQACFGNSVACDKPERCYRFFEEAAELVQAGGMTREDCHQLVDYAYDRSGGELQQEVGGVAVTLAALCTAFEINMALASETELVRIHTRIDAIRAKHERKQHRSPLPGDSP